MASFNLDSFVTKANRVTEPRFFGSSSYPEVPAIPPNVDFFEWTGDLSATTLLLAANILEECQHDIVFSVLNMLVNCMLGVSPRTGTDKIKEIRRISYNAQAIDVIKEYNELTPKEREHVERPTISEPIATLGGYSAQWIGDFPKLLEGQEFGAAVAMLFWALDKRVTEEQFPAFLDNRFDGVESFLAADRTFFVEGNPLITLENLQKINKAAQLYPSLLGRLLKKVIYRKGEIDATTGMTFLPYFGMMGYHEMHLLTLTRDVLPSYPFLLDEFSEIIPMVKRVDEAFSRLELVPEPERPYAKIIHKNRYHLIDGQSCQILLYLMVAFGALNTPSLESFRLPDLGEHFDNRVTQCMVKRGYKQVKSTEVKPL